MPFDQSDLLRQAGYSDGDFPDIITYPTSDTAVTTSDTYSTVLTSQLRPRLVWDNIWTLPESIHVQAFGVVDTTGDEIDIRVQNLQDNETVLEETGLTLVESFTIGPIPYVPTSRTSRTRYVFQIRNSDNSTDVRVLGPTLRFAAVY